MATETTTYRVRSNLIGQTNVARLLISKPIDYPLCNCRPIHVAVTSNELDGDNAASISSGACARVSIICADPNVPYLGNGSPITYEEYIAADVAHPDSAIQPTIQYQAANVLTGNNKLRSEINLMQIQKNQDAVLTPVGPTTYPFFPYIVRIYAPIAFTAMVTVQFL